MQLRNMRRKLKQKRRNFEIKTVLKRRNFEAGEERGDAKPGVLVYFAAKIINLIISIFK